MTQTPFKTGVPVRLQLFYRGKGKGGMWYDPTFQASVWPGMDSMKETNAAMAMPARLLPWLACRRRTMPP